MTSKVPAGRRGWDMDSISSTGPTEFHGDPEVEAEATAVAAWFATLPAALQAYLDREARHGTEAYRRP